MTGADEPARSPKEALADLHGPLERHHGVDESPFGGRQEIRYDAGFQARDRALVVAGSEGDETPSERPGPGRNDERRPEVDECRAARRGDEDVPLHVAVEDSARPEVHEEGVEIVEEGLRHARCARRNARESLDPLEKERVGGRAGEEPRNPGDAVEAGVGTSLASRH